MGVALWPETEREELVPASAFDEAATAVAHTEYRTDPTGWAVEKMGIPEYTIRWSLCGDDYASHAWDGDVDPLAMIAEALRDWKNVGCESGTGTGKSFWMGVLILWFLACFKDSRVFTFAPKEDQLRLYIWMEIGKLWPKFSRYFPDAVLTDLAIRMNGVGDDSWGARGISVALSAGESVNTKAAGQHAEHMLLVYEETPGIALSVLEAGENTCTAPHNLRVAIGNPNHRLDALHKFCTSPGTVHVRMSSLDHPNVVADDPNVVPGAVSRVAIERRRIKYGEESPVYQSRVCGNSPEQATDALIRLSWLEAADLRFQARKRLGTMPTRVTGKGVDVANSEHGDRACIVDFAQAVCIRVEAFQCPDSNALGRQVKLEMDAADLEAKRVGVDAIGVGAGTVNELRRLKRVVQALQAGGSPLHMTEKAPDGKEREWTADVNVFKNLRSQMYWQAREDLRTGVIDVEKDQELWDELVEPTYVDDPKTVVEPKDEIKERLGRSPDKADAFVMANWVRERAIVLPDRDEKYDKTPHRARPWQVDDQGHPIPHAKSPKSADELAERLTGKKNQNRTVFRRLVPPMRTPR